MSSPITIARMGGTTVLALVVVGSLASSSHAYQRPSRSTVVTTPAVETPVNEGDSISAAISGNGRYIAIESFNKALVSPDLNPLYSDIFLYNRLTGGIELISVSSAGMQGLGSSDNPAISSNGRFVAFNSDASNLVPGDTNLATDVFVHDARTGQTTLISSALNGEEANGASVSPSISSNGRLVAFRSTASNLVEGDTNYHPPP